MTWGNFYSLHMPEVKWIAMGKVNKSYEITEKVTLPVTRKWAVRWLSSVAVILGWRCGEVMGGRN